MSKKAARRQFLLNLLFWPSAAVTSLKWPQVGIAVIILAIGYFVTMTSFMRWAARAMEQKKWLEQMKTCDCSHKHWMHVIDEGGLAGECRVPGCGCIAFTENTKL